MFERLSRQPGVDVKVFHGRTIPGTKLVNGADLSSIQHVELPTLSLRVRTADRESVAVVSPTVAFHLARFRPDVILAEGGSNLLTNVFVYIYGRITGTPIVWWTLGSLRGRVHRGLASSVYRSVVVGMERSAAALLGYSSVALEYFREMGYDARKQFRAVNCVDTERVLSRLPEDRRRALDLRNDLGLESSDFVVVFVGALQRAKRIDRLLRAVARARESESRIRAVIVGDGSERGSLESLATALGLDRSVRFTGEVIGGVGAYFEIADLFVLPGLGGLAISEAMVHGKPVVCGVGDGCEVDLVRDDVNGYRLSEEELDEGSRLAGLLVRFARNPSACLEMGAASAKIISDEHNVQTYLRQVESALRFAVAEGGRGA